MNQEQIKIRLNNFIVILIIFMITSCVTDKRIFQKKRFAEVGQVKIQTAIKLERRAWAKDISPDHLIEIGEGLYPNPNKFILVTPKIYKLKERPNFEKEVDYFYTSNDNSVKAILYDWNKSRRTKHRIFISESNTPEIFKAFQVKFDWLKERLSNELGDPIEINITQSPNLIESYKDYIKWKGKTGLNAFLILFGNKYGYREIRLVIYKD